MNNRFPKYGLAVLVGALGAGAFALAQPAGSAKQPPAKAENTKETEIKLADLPAPVRAAALKLTGEKNITKVTKEVDEGVTTYEVEFTENGATSSGDFSSAGDVIEVERGLTQEKLPAPVLAALKKSYPGVSFGNIAAVTKMYYEVEIVKEGKKHEVEVNAAGEIKDKSKHENGKEEDEENEEDEKNEKNEKK